MKPEWCEQTRIKERSQRNQVIRSEIHKNRTCQVGICDLSVGYF